MNRVLKVLMNRDGMCKEEAIKCIQLFNEEFQQTLQSGCSYDDAMQLMEDHFGLEPDYLEDFI